MQDNQATMDEDFEIWAQSAHLIDEAMSHTFKTIYKMYPDNLEDFVKGYELILIAMDVSPTDSDDFYEMSKFVEARRALL